MQIQRKIAKAATIIECFSEKQRLDLYAICLEIQDAQNILNRVAEPFFRQCLQHCQGLCCRNIHVDDIVTLLDYIFILASDQSLLNRVHACAQRESFFSADCIFLQNNIGPCLFNPNTKPERCIITFCSDTRPIRREIKSVRKTFNSLQRYVAFRQPVKWFIF